MATFHHSHDLVLVQHADLHTTLLRLAEDEGVVIERGVQVISVKATDSGPQVTLADGVQIFPGIVIGADGPSSTVRRTAFNYQANIKFGGVTALNGIVPASEIAQDAILQERLGENQMRVVADCFRVFQSLKLLFACATRCSGRFLWAIAAAFAVSILHLKRPGFLLTAV